MSEVKTDKGVEQRLESKRLQYLREEALAFESDQDEAALAAEEDPAEKKIRNLSSNVSAACDEDDCCTEADAVAPFFCYMCYETHDTPEDHLVAPCDCKGDTRYLHVQCLQKWYQSSVCGSRALVIRTTGNGAPACKICGAAYKTVFRNNGVKTSLLEVEHPGPYISLVVVTRHDTSPGLFNTKFRLHFGPGYRVGGEAGQLQDDPELSPSELTIGRSSVCNMVLDYRTVSTVHAKLLYRNGQFLVQDARSSNGTMVYLQGPLPLQPNQPVRLRMGRSTLAIQVRRSLSASLKGTLQRAPTGIPCSASLARLQAIMALAPPFVPKSIRNADGGGESDSAAIGREIGGPIVDRVVEEPRPNSVRLHAQPVAWVDLDDVSSGPPPIAASAAPAGMSAGSVLLPSEGVDGAMILGEPRRVSSRPSSAAEQANEVGPNCALHVCGAHNAYCVQSGSADCKPSGAVVPPLPTEDFSRSVSATMRGGDSREMDADRRCMSASSYDVEGAGGSLSRRSSRGSKARSPRHSSSGRVSGEEKAAGENGADETSSPRELSARRRPTSGSNRRSPRDSTGEGGAGPQEPS